MPVPRMRNALSVDVEDWRQAGGFETALDADQIAAI